MSTMSAASMATDVPEESAIPSVAATRAGESLMPSPTYCGQKKLNVNVCVELRKKRSNHCNPSTIFLHELSHYGSLTHRTHIRPNILRSNSHLFGNS